MAKATDRPTIPAAAGTTPPADPPVDPPAGDDAAEQPQPDAGKKGKKASADDRIAALEAQNAALMAKHEEFLKLLNAGAVNAVESVQERKSKAEQDAFKAELNKGRERLTQEAADRAFPEGRHRYRCHLADGNGHPPVVISAETETDAAARYQRVCGITSSEKPVAVERA